MDTTIRKRLDAQIGALPEDEVKELALAWRRREAKRKREEQARYMMMCNARNELLAREQETTDQSRKETP